MVAVSFNIDAVSDAGGAMCSGRVGSCEERYVLSVTFEDGYRYDRCLACGRAHWLTSTGEIVPLPAA